MSTNTHLFFRERPGTTKSWDSRFFFRKRLSQSVTGLLPPAEPTPIWTGDWRLAIAEERVAMAEQRVAIAEERLARALEQEARQSDGRS